MGNGSNSFSSNERRMLLVVVVLVVIIGGLFFYLGTRFSVTNGDDGDSIVMQKEMGHSSRSTSYSYAQPDERPVERFAFDPNTADSTTLLRLGLRPWQVRNIYRFRARGGVYRQPSDFARLYGLTVKQYRELEPYIQISSDYQPAAEVYATHTVHEEYPRDTLRYPMKLKPGQQIVLNRADTTQLKKVPGIGSSWARAIIGYGNRLGGYCRVNQLLEIDGFPESALPYFRIDHPQLVKVKVNTSSVSKLRRHPYINFYQARAIFDYVRLHGPLKDIHQLNLLPEFPPKELERLAPYMEY